MFSSNRRVAVAAAMTLFAASGAWAQLARVQPQVEPKEEILVSPPPSGLAPPNPTAAATVRDLAARARASKLAGETRPPAASESVLAQPVSGAQAIPLAQRSTTAAKASFDPRLVSIVGSKGRERVELAVDGVIYSVSMLHPAVGGTGWRLTGIDTDDVSVRIAKISDGGKDKSPSAYAIGFSRREVDSPAGGQAANAQLIPGILPFPAR